MNTQDQLEEAMVLLGELRDGSGMSEEQRERYDRLANGEWNDGRSDYEKEIVTRSAPRWAWEVIDETLEVDSNSSAFGIELRDRLRQARADGFDPTLVFEDRKEDTAMWREEGLLCCQVAVGDY